MRTTVNLEDNLLKELKRRAIKENVTLGTVLNATLKQVLLEANGESDEDEEKPLKTFCGSGLQAGVDLNDGRSLRDLMEA